MALHPDAHTLHGIQARTLHATSDSPAIETSGDLAGVSTAITLSTDMSPLAFLSSTSGSDRQRQQAAASMRGTTDSAEQAALIDLIVAHPSSTAAFVASDSLRSVVTGEAARRLVALLEVRDWTTRVRACHALQGSPDLDVQRALLKVVQYESTRKFGDPHAPNTGEVILREMDKREQMNTPLRQEMLAAVEAAGNLPHWIFGPGASKVPVFVFAAEALQGSTHLEIANGLARMARSPETSARLCAVEGLTASAFPERCETLVTLLSDRTPVFRSTIGEKAAYALQKTDKTPDIVDRLVELLNDKGAPLFERKLAAISLYNEPGAAGALASIAANRVRMAREVRNSTALQRTNADPIHGDLLTQGVSDLRRSAAASVNVDVPEAARILASSLVRTSWFNNGISSHELALEKRDVADKLKGVEDSAVVETLRRGLGKRDNLVVEQTIRALTGNHSLEVQAEIARHLGSGSKKVAHAAWYCLYQSGHATIREAADAYFQAHMS